MYSALGRIIDAPLNKKSWGPVVAFPHPAFTVLGFAPFYLFPVPLLTLSVLCHFWRRSTTSTQTALLGFSFGMGMFSAGVTWIYVSLHDFGGMPMAAAVLALFFLCAYLSLFPALAGWLLKKLNIVTPIVWSL